MKGIYNMKKILGTILLVIYSIIAIAVTIILLSS